MKRHVSPRSFPARVIAFTVVAALLGTSVLGLSTRFGAGLTPDSINYIDSARSLAEGLGYGSVDTDGSFHYIARFPGLYPLTLSLARQLGADPLPFARVLCCLFYGLTVVLTGSIACLLELPAWASMLAIALVAFSPTSLDVFSMAWSEPLSAVLVMATVLSLELAARRESAPLIACSGILGGLSFLARFVAISATVSTGVSALLHLGIRRSLQFAAGACLPLILWLVYLLATGASVERMAAFHPPPLQRLSDGLVEVGSWFFPGLPGYFGVVVLCAMLITFSRHREDLGRSSIVTNLALFVAIFVSALLVSISFFDAETPLNRRILSPIHPALMMLFVLAMNHWPRRIRLAISLIALVGTFVASFGLVKQRMTDGTGFASSQWQMPELWARIKIVDGPIYSNGPDVIRLFAGRAVYYLPQKADPSSRTPNPAAAAALGAIRASGGTVVHFKMIRWRWYLPTVEELEAHLGWPKEYEDEAVIIYSSIRGGQGQVDLNCWVHGTDPTT